MVVSIAGKAIIDIATEIGVSQVTPFTVLCRLHDAKILTNEQHEQIRCWLIRREDERMKLWR